MRIACGYPSFYPGEAVIDGAFGDGVSISGGVREAGHKKVRGASQKRVVPSGAGMARRPV